MLKKAFKRALCIKTKAEFNEVLNSGKKFGMPGLVMYVKINTLMHPRLGIIISKRHIPLAVKRNQIKRQIRESFRVNQQEISNIDIVVMVNKSIGSMDKQQIRLCLGKQWVRLQKRCAKV